VRAVAPSELHAHDPGLYSFVNVNTPQEWERIEALRSWE
jgi:molybdopterin-guanine dinucleotide biosynthesis protein A